MLRIIFAKRTKVISFSLRLLVVWICIWCAQWPSISTAASEIYLNEKQVRGEQIFLQRCSICHLPPAVRLQPHAQPLGPNLTSVLKDTNTQNEKAVRQRILQGGPQMPGFQYGLSPREMNDLIAYMKTL